MGQVTISNKYFDNLLWLPAADCSYQPNNSVDIWRVHIPSHLDHINNFLNVLALAEIARASQYVRTDDRNRSVISRGALRIILGSYLDELPQAISFTEGVNKKPILDDDSGLHFNVSHSGAWALIAVANSQVGVDVEFINSNMSYQEILPEYFVDEEMVWVNQYNSVERFYMLWTRKEALAKGVGMGLDSKMKFFPALDGDHYFENDDLSTNNDWSISSFNLAEDYMGSVANKLSAHELTFLDFEKLI
jgi:4'-phosphopantetheinyl transferase